MSTRVSKPILDALTDVEMPRLPLPPAVETVLDVDGVSVPAYAYDTVVVGSGAAGLRAAVELARRGNRVAIISQSAWGGTSACSGSDKQTLHTANTASRGDDYHALAAALRAGGAMDADTAYVEAVGSGRAMASLQYLGLPLPQDGLGGTLRYQTDHDEVGRATSCGPRTSRLMVQVLAEEATRLGVPFFNQTTASSLLTTGSAETTRSCGLLAIQNAAQGPDNPHGHVVFMAENVVLAAGGPGELYRDSVYPNGCFGVLGLALEADMEVVNLTESQFGIGTRREGFPWNLSGTYMQAIPHIYSVDAVGAEHHFLAPYYPSTRALASNIFRKGYQWPFHATRMLDFGSSLIDIAIHQECQKGRKVFMDFNRNPLPGADGAAFTLANLDEDVRAYLGQAGATQAAPIERLLHMNPLSIELYRRYKIDIAASPLEFAVNNQHMNGGIAVDIWGRSSLPGCYAIGEAAGTHGVTRPGGAALNAGQVFGTRVAEHIAETQVPGTHPAPQIDKDQTLKLAAPALARIEALFSPEAQRGHREVRQEIQARMSDDAGILCAAGPVKDARLAAQDLWNTVTRDGLRLERPKDAARAVQWSQMALASLAVLTALDHYISNGGGSRGARAILDPKGTAIPTDAQGPMTDLRFREGRVEDEGKQIVLRYMHGQINCDERANRAHDPDAQAFFERDWPAWLTGAVFDRA